MMNPFLIFIIVFFGVIVLGVVALIIITQLESPPATSQTVNPCGDFFDLFLWFDTFTYTPFLSNDFKVNLVQINDKSLSVALVSLCNVADLADFVPVYQVFYKFQSDDNLQYATYSHTPTTTRGDLVYSTENLPIGYLFATSQPYKNMLMLPVYLYECTLTLTFINEQDNNKLAQQAVVIGVMTTVSDTILNYCIPYNGGVYSFFYSKVSLIGYTTTGSLPITFGCPI